MAISRCPECNDEVQIPPGASPSAIVECPWCSAEFELKRLLDVMPPVLIVKSDPDSKSAEAASVSINVAEQNDLPMFDFKEREAPQAESIAPTLNAPAVRRPRPQPKGSGLISAAAVLFGGLCAIPLAQLCLWWIFGQDPVEAGPTVAKYVAFIVPKQFRGNGPPVTPPRVSEDNSASMDSGRARQQPRDTGSLSTTSSSALSG